MKKMMLTGLLFCFVAFNASAQTKAHSKKGTTLKASHKSKAKNAKSDTTVMLTNSGSYPAMATDASTNFRIADPTINALNAKAAGATVPKSTSELIGLPKYRNGFANGHILLRNTTATSSGTAFGSGAVGTGTSLQGVGASESTLGTNGKSPYAGTSLWGDRQTIVNKGTDSSRRQ